ncbi:peptidoglycan-binding domain-containing protein [Anaeromyxobacter sp. SG17]|uniref:peptidoglycan-binding domain-containing protein n=1 Tax=Anaeromyxobacter sp. SG17 TaxID=2925405 RepID=UPI001F57E861|nr:peptidoglycan-binding domain-containing protein [Anaeromyxobacter sp. SG17]
MIRRRTLVVAVALAAAACRHPQHPTSPAGGESPRPEAPDRAGEKGVPPKAGRPRIPAGPEALLAPGAVKDIQGALADRGLLGEHRAGELDAPTSRALRKFQESQDLAATGFPDRETLQRLGVDPDRAYGREGGGEGD